MTASLRYSSQQQHPPLRSCLRLHSRGVVALSAR